MEFISFSPENISVMRKTRQFLDEYNATAYDDGEQRIALLHEMLGLMRKRRDNSDAI